MTPLRVSSTCAVSWRRCSVSPRRTSASSRCFWVRDSAGNCIRGPMCHSLPLSRQLGKPVKLVVSRKMMFQSVGHRARTQQRVRLGASPDGKLVSLEHEYAYHMSMLDMYHEDCGEATPFQYSVPNLRVSFGRARRNVGATADMRGPGAVPGLYPTES